MSGSCSVAGVLTTSYLVLHNCKGFLCGIQSELDILRRMGTRHKASFISGRCEINTVIKHGTKETAESIGVTRRGLSKVIHTGLRGEEHAEHATCRLGHHRYPRRVGTLLQAVT